jgi:hypothetical protein
MVYNYDYSRILWTCPEALVSGGLGGGQKLQTKPKIQVVTSGVGQMEVVSTSVKIEPDDVVGLKRKRDDEEMDHLTR